MSAFDETVHDCNRICPYCGHEYQVEAEDYSEDEREEECDECGKQFVAYDSFSVSCYAKPDCELNGDSHKFKIHENPLFGHCEVCGKCKRMEE